MNFDEIFGRISELTGYRQSSGEDDPLCRRIMTGESVAEGVLISIQLVGDEGVGKTSLMLSLINDEYTDAAVLLSSSFNRSHELPTTSYCEDILISRGSVGISECVIRDLNVERGVWVRPDVYCVMVEGGYHADEESCHLCDQLERVRSHWIPWINDLRQLDTDSARTELDWPCIVLVISKEDFSFSNKNCVNDCDCCTRAIRSILEEFNQIECVVSCSSMQMTNVAEVFYAAQTSVIFPTRHLLARAPDSDHFNFTKQFQLALRHVFYVLSRFHDKLDLTNIQDLWNFMADDDRVVEFDELCKIVMESSIKNSRPQLLWSLLGYLYKRNLVLKSNLIPPAIDWTNTDIVDFAMSLDLSPEKVYIFEHLSIVAIAQKLFSYDRFLTTSRLLCLRKIAPDQAAQILGVLGFGRYIFEKRHYQRCCGGGYITKPLCYLIKLVSSDEMKLDCFLKNLPNVFKYDETHFFACSSNDSDHESLVFCVDCSVLDYDCLCVLDDRDHVDDYYQTDDDDKLCVRVTNNLPSESERTFVIKDNDDRAVYVRMCRWIWQQCSSDDDNYEIPRPPPAAAITESFRSLFVSAAKHIKWAYLSPNSSNVFTTLTIALCSISLNSFIVALSTLMWKKVVLSSNSFFRPSFTQSTVSLAGQTCWEPYCSECSPKM